MAEPKNATTGRGGRQYSWRDKQYWSVTTIQGTIGSEEGLINWAKLYTAEYACANVGKLLALLEPDSTGVIDYEGAIAWLKDASYRDRDKAGEIGTEVHEAINAYILGKPFPTWSREIELRMKNFERFLDDYRPDFSGGQAEATVINKTMHYAGTLDAISTFPVGDGLWRVGLWDVKTKAGTRYPISGRRQPRIYPEVALQLAAYRHAEIIAAPDGSEQPMPNVDFCAILHLTDEDYDFIEVRADEEVFKIFLYAREILRWNKEIAKSVLLGPVRRGDFGEAAVELANRLGAKPTELALVRDPGDGERSAPSAEAGEHDGEGPEATAAADPAPLPGQMEIK